jgi:hypothetical protein
MRRRTKGESYAILLSRGFTHDDGWFDILWRLCGDLEPLVKEFEQATVLQFEILQVKEKFGVLRIYVKGANAAIRQRIGAAAQESFHTCEVCGQPGELREGSWIKTLCDEHDASGQEAEDHGCSNARATLACMPAEARRL